METNFIKKSINIKTDIDTAWNYLTKITTLDWVDGEKSTKFLTNKKRGVGAVRLISFDDGTNVEEHIVGWSPKKIFFIYCNIWLTIRCISCYYLNY